MKKLALALLILATPAYAATAFYTHETVSGSVKICFYESYKGTHAINVASYAVCPLQISVPD